MSLVADLHSVDFSANLWAYNSNDWNFVAQKSTSSPNFANPNFWTHFGISSLFRNFPNNDRLTIINNNQ